MKALIVMATLQELLLCIDHESGVHGCSSPRYATEAVAVGRQPPLECQEEQKQCLFQDTIHFLGSTMYRPYPERNSTRLPAPVIQAIQVAGNSAGNVLFLVLVRVLVVPLWCAVRSLLSAILATG